jgi:predicted nicotinamide N-methyase
MEKNSEVNPEVTLESTIRAFNRLAELREAYRKNKIGTDIEFQKEEFEKMITECGEMGFGKNEAEDVLMVSDFVFNRMRENAMERWTIN